MLVEIKQPLKIRLKGFARRSFLRVKHPSRVTCYQCGFLSFGDNEVTFQHREVLASGEPSLSVEKLRCFRSCWTEYGVYEWGEDVVRSELEIDRRDCPGFFRHRQGWTPNEHRDLLSKRLETRQKIAFAFFGSFLTLLVAWLAKLLGMR